MSRSIIFLRSAREHDPYLSLFQQAGYQANCVPVLSFGFVAAKQLTRKLSRPGNYAGLILTSPRAVAAIERVADTVPSALSEWSAKLTFVVGKRTGELAGQIGLRTKGEGSGNAHNLAEMIPPDAQPYLFLSGSRRRDVLPDRLTERGVLFEELCVYETHVREDIEAADLCADWLAFFSPSGIKAVAEIRSVRDRRVAAIGPTTGAALREHGISVDAVAGSPSPEALLAAIQGASHN